MLGSDASMCHRDSDIVQYEVLLEQETWESMGP